MINKQFAKNNIAPAIAIVYAIAVSVAATVVKSDFFPKFNTYLSAAVSFWITCIIMKHVIGEHDTGIRLYSALGMCCLVLGNLYFILLDIVSFTPDDISVGLFAKVCCYLFFISALTGLKRLSKTNLIVVNIISALSAVACAYSVITNNYLIINISLLLLNILCLILAISLLSDRKAHFFAMILLIIAAKDILSIFTVLSFITDSLSPALFILFSRSVICLKEGKRYAD